ncbi:MULTISPECIES: Zn-ribbon domain-containing OB-fold protein [unclassified Lysinibacillus]|uniref:Zn-ribbon domain-containing OB-fold protein n=1 Tax=unclassified Lysinibacillus TaxID=2636778 RepID=UPI0011756463|nr:OB-fold domain-containing protein [Lysinibacillus sp. CD3-6]QPQ35744.1 OB-fold domain-containing protein [Lysinibacillus sp. JNUCC-52]UED78142.1 OB-fold domain-containing protein [Lysinibacillus sp. CD3-6]
MSYQKPIPLKTQDNQPYWDAADRHELVLQKCETCNSYNHPPGPACSKCGATELSWESQGSDITGTIYSYVVSYRPFLPGFQDDLPTIIVVVQLDKLNEVKIIGNVLACPPEEIKIGMPVKMTWQDITEDRALPQWIQA